MGRIKDFFIELQNKYGENLEDLPSGFSMDKYLAEKSKEMSSVKTASLFCEKFKQAKIEKETN